MFAYVRSIFHVLKTDINNIDEENGYCVMMVLADSKNVIKIFFYSSFFVFSFYYPSFFAVMLTKISRKQKKRKNRFSCVYLRVLWRWRRKGKGEEDEEKRNKKTHRM